VNACLELARVQVPPGPLRQAVVADKVLLAAGTRPQSTLSMLDAEVDPRRLDVELHFGRPSASRQTKNLLLELSVEHGADLRGAAIFPGGQGLTHTKPGWTRIQTIGN
jgi:hypothetical protein